MPRIRGKKRTSRPAGIESRVFEPCDEDRERHGLGHFSAFAKTVASVNAVPRAVKICARNQAIVSRLTRQRLRMLAQRELASSAQVFTAVTGPASGHMKTR